MNYKLEDNIYSKYGKALLTAAMPQDLPDADGILNKTDPYLRVKVVGNPTKKTPTIKNSLNPVFKEDNSFVFTGGVGTWVEVICMDWDPLSKDDDVVKVGRLMDAFIEMLSHLCKQLIWQLCTLHRFPSS